MVADITMGEVDYALLGRTADGEREICAKRFVLCAGVYGSSSILLRSGVGPAKDLASLGIPVHTDLSGVGANLHDHPGVALEYKPTARALRAVKSEDAEGRFYQAQLVLRTAPDLHVMPYQSVDDDGAWSFLILAFYLDPRSRGRMRLSSREPDALPKIELGLLGDRKHQDVRALVQGLRLIHDLTKRSPLAALIERGPRRFDSDARLARYVRDSVSDYGHSVGTCRMGTSPATGDVVDPRGRVHGLANVFVADASIVPRIPRANTNLTCCVIGARIADFLASG
jgi:choline dehydrogenase